MSKIPNALKYSTDHEWVAAENGIATIGITDHAQELMTDIVFVELPEVGDTVDKDDAVAVVESVKSASDVYSPVSGKIVEVNTEVEEAPETVNSDPYGDGWIFKVKMSDPSELADLMNAEAYTAYIDSQESVE